MALEHSRSFFSVYLTFLFLEKEGANIKINLDSYSPSSSLIFKHSVTSIIHQTPFIQHVIEIILFINVNHFRSPMIRIVNEVRTLHEFQQNDACARYHTDGGIVFTILTGIINIYRLFFNARSFVNKPYRRSSDQKRRGKILKQEEVYGNGIQQILVLGCCCNV